MHWLIAALALPFAAEAEAWTAGGGMLGSASVAGVCGYLIIKQIPKMQADFLLGLRETQQSYLHELRAERHSRERIVRVLFLILVKCTLPPGIKEDDEITEALRSLALEKLNEAGT